MHAAYLTGLIIISFSVVYAGFSPEALRSRILDGRLHISPYDSVLVRILCCAVSKIKGYYLFNTFICTASKETCKSGAVPL